MNHVLAFVARHSHQNLISWRLHDPQHKHVMQRVSDDERDLRGKDGAVENAKSSNVEKASSTSSKSGGESRPNAEETGGDGDHPPGVERGRKRGVPVREAIQRLCVRSFRSSSSLVYYAGVDIVSIFDEGERPKRIKSKSYPRPETISFLKP